MCRKRFVTQPELYLRRLVQARAPARDAEDIVQTILLSCLQAGYLRDEQDRRVPVAFLRMIAQRRIADYYRDRSRRAPRGNFNLTRPTEYYGPDYAQLAEVRDAVCGLKPPYQRLIQECYYHGRTIRQIAEARRAPLETVRTQHKRALTALRLALESRT